MNSHLPSATCCQVNFLNVLLEPSFELFCLFRLAVLQKERGRERGRQTETERKREKERKKEREEERMCGFCVMFMYVYICPYRLMCLCACMQRLEIV